MVRVKFWYKDELSHWERREQECIVESVKECIEIYGLDECEYGIISVEEITYD